MNCWKDLHEDLPTVAEIVEVCVCFGHGGTTRLRGYRLVGRAGGESLWLNALTHAPFPEGWQVVRWKRAETEMVGCGVTRFTAAGAGACERA
ncbi:MAG TPA: hypothetical protein VME21_09330 [Steroidobacteraceae bacterium]|nr:hypothetical protein [Steroidobacteraceae bacterium]